MRTLNEYNQPIQPSSSNINSYDYQSHQNLSEHIPSSHVHQVYQLIDKIEFYQQVIIHQIQVQLLYHFNVLIQKLLIIHQNTIHLMIVQYDLISMAFINK
jgi:hypothetical protein